MKLGRPHTSYTVIVPLHHELARVTLASSCREAGRSLPELAQHLARRRRDPPGLER